MDCKLCRDLLVESLDVPAEGVGGEVENHLTTCTACRQWSLGVQRLASGLQTLPKVTPPTGLAERIFADWAKESVHPSQPTWWRRALPRLLALAACVAVVVSATLYWTNTRLAKPTVEVVIAPKDTPRDRSSHIEDVNPQPTPELVPSEFAESDLLREAGTALASLTTRTAEETVENGMVFVPVVAKPLGNFELPEPVVTQDATRPFVEASGGVTMGFDPVRDSARRAVNLFLRDYNPMSSGLD